MQRQLLRDQLAAGDLQSARHHQRADIVAVDGQGALVPQPVPCPERHRNKDAQRLAGLLASVGANLVTMDAYVIMCQVRSEPTKHLVTCDEDAPEAEGGSAQNHGQNGLGVQP